MKPIFKFENLFLQSIVVDNLEIAAFQEFYVEKEIFLE